MIGNKLGPMCFGIEKPWILYSPKSLPFSSREWNTALQELLDYDSWDKPKHDLPEKNWYFVTKIVLICCEKNCSSDWEKLLKFEAEGQEFAKCLRSVEQFIQTVRA